jgi:PAS domain S-box-containing protein
MFNVAELNISADQEQLKTASGAGTMSTNPMPSRNPSEAVRFEHLLVYLSLPAERASEDQIRIIVKTTQESLRDILQSDRSGLARFDEQSKLFIVTDLSRATHSPHRFVEGELPWVAYKMFRGEPFEFCKITEIAEGVSKEIDNLFDAKIQCATFIPLGAGEQRFGFLGFASSRTESHRSPKLQERLLAVANDFSNALAGNPSRLASSNNEQARAEGDERYQKLLQTFPLAVLLTDNAGRIYASNSRALELLGYSGKELIGSSVEALLPERFRAAHVEKRAQFAANPVDRPMGDARQLCALKKDGNEIDVEIALSTIQTAEGSMVFTAITDITERSRSRQALEEVNRQLVEANEKIREMKERLDNEIVHLKQEIKLDSVHTDIVGQSPALLKVLKDAEMVAATDSAVLILGETGTGKELIARTIHRNSKRKGRTMVNVNCAALPASLVENELFGRERGAYTGALTREIGRFELADRSTIFLDEIGELPLELQGKLLRILQEGDFERLGSSKTIHVDVRVIAATSRDLEKEVKEGKFREDLYYRLNVFPIRVPPLRDRREDIPMITWHFLHLLGDRMGRDVEMVHATTMAALQHYRWPGNVRELRNVIERSLIMSPGPVFVAEMPAGFGNSTVAGTTIEEIERNHIIRLLEQSGWRVRGPAGAAEALGLKPTTLEARMKKLGIFRDSQQIRPR